MNTASIAVLNLRFFQVPTWGDPFTSVVHQLRAWFPQGVPDHQLFDAEVVFDLKKRSKSAQEKHYQELRTIVDEWKGFVFHSFRYIISLRGGRMGVKRLVIMIWTHTCDEGKLQISEKDEATVEEVKRIFHSSSAFILIIRGLVFLQSTGTRVIAVLHRSIFIGVSGILRGHLESNIPIVIR